MKHPLGATDRSFADEPDAASLLEAAMAESPPWPEPEEPPAGQRGATANCAPIALGRGGSNSRLLVLKRGVQERVRHLVHSIDDELAGRFASSQVQRSIDVLAHAFAFREYTVTAAYLRARPYLIDLLVEAGRVLSDVAPRARATIEILTDEDSAEKRLYLVVAVEESLRRAAELQDLVDDTWWFHEGQRALGEMNIVIESVSASRA